MYSGQYGSYLLRIGPGSLLRLSLVATIKDIENVMFGFSGQFYKSFDEQQSHATVFHGYLMESIEIKPRGTRKPCLAAAFEYKVDLRQKRQNGKDTVLLVGLEHGEHLRCKSGVIFLEKL
jgi:hypothetical protein